jgi:hypothetical protein
MDVMMKGSKKKKSEDNYYQLLHGLKTKAKKEAGKKKR